VAKARQQGLSIKSAAAQLGVSAKWIRAQVAAGSVTPSRSSDKRNARYLFSEADIVALRALVAASAADTAIPAASSAVAAAEAPAALARVTRLEAERANLIAQVAWERAIAQEQQKALEAERARTAKLAADLELMHARVEALKALSAWDRVMGRHKAV
jgi:DNA-binding transcriptional MerR regulator